MTDAEAMKFMAEEAFPSEGEAKLKLIRAKQSSVQLSTYLSDAWPTTGCASKWSAQWAAPSASPVTTMP